jgi:predicted P-loop ATPase
MTNRDYTETIDFVETLFGDGKTEGTIELRSFADDGREARSMFTCDPEDMRNHLDSFDEPGRGMYIGAVTRRPNATQGRRQDCCEMVALWVDIDVYNIDLTKEDAVAALKNAPYRPSIVIDSGGGIQAWWALNEAMNLVGTERDQEIVATLKQLGGVFCGDLKVCDIARVMRLPGTINAKHGEERVAVIVEQSGATYELDDLQDWLAYQRPLLASKIEEDEPEKGNPFTAYVSGKGKSPVDVKAALEVMELGGAEKTSIHQTQLSVSASLISKGHDPEEIVNLLLNATRIASGSLERVWNWAREESKIRDMIATGIKKYAPEMAAKNNNEGRVGKLGEWAKDLVVNKDGKILKSTGNVTLLMTGHPEVSGFLRFNEFAQSMDVVKLTPWSHEYPREMIDADVHEFRMWAEKVLEAHNIEDRHIKAAMHTVANRLKYNPLQDWLRECHQYWIDAGRPIGRVSGFFGTYWGADDTPLNQTISRCFLLSCVERAMRPGAKVDVMVVAEGAQGIGKSTGFRALVPENSSWFSDSHLNLTASQKEIGEMIAGTWIQEMAELSAIKSPKDQHRLKAALTQQDDRFRPAYGVVARTIPRPTVFVGTHNPDNRGWNMDPTGSRRFLPIQVTSVDVRGIAAERKLIWGEAVSAAEAGESHWEMGPEIAAELNQRNADRTVHDDHVEEFLTAYITHVPVRDSLAKEVKPIDKWTERQQPLEYIIAHHATAEIWGEPAARKNQFKNVVSRALQLIGWREDCHFIHPETGKRIRALVPEGANVLRTDKGTKKRIRGRVARMKR